MASIAGQWTVESRAPRSGLRTGLSITAAATQRSPPREPTECSPMPLTVYFLLIFRLDRTTDFHFYSSRFTFSFSIRSTRISLDLITFNLQNHVLSSFITNSMNGVQNFKYDCYLKTTTNPLDYHLKHTHKVIWTEKQKFYKNKHRNKKLIMI